MVKTSHNLLLLHIVLFTIVCITGCENDIQSVRELGEKKTGVERGTNINSYYSQEGKMKAHLTAPVMLRYLTDSTLIEFPESIHVDFYDSTLKIETRLFAKYARYNENEKLVYLRDSIIIFKINGDTLRTEKLWWDQGKELIYTDVKVQIRQFGSPQALIGEYGMEAKQDMSKWTLRSATGPLPPMADSIMPAF